MLVICILFHGRSPEAARRIAAGRVCESPIAAVHVHKPGDLITEKQLHLQCHRKTCSAEVCLHTRSILPGNHSGARVRHRSICSSCKVPVPNSTSCYTAPGSCCQQGLLNLVNTERVQRTSHHQEPKTPSGMTDRMCHTPALLNKGSSAMHHRNSTYLNTQEAAQATLSTVMTDSMTLQAVNLTRSSSAPARNWTFLIGFPASRRRLRLFAGVSTSAPYAFSALAPANLARSLALCALIQTVCNTPSCAPSMKLWDRCVPQTLQS